ncbi:MAG: hypothetical protein JWO90_848, partial [Solirubrobacterales bacterium]|nr:hypothetical protein [Solirubrobacterales bacterium]
MSLALVLLAALLAAGLAGWPQDARRRDKALVAAALLTPVLLLVHIEDTDAFASLVDRPPVLAAAAVLGLGAVAGLGALFVRVPTALPMLAVAALPFRVPIAVDGSTANL